MRSKKVWRYYCEHCGKGSLSKHSMTTHEPHCTNNPNRKCRMCALAGLEPAPMAELLATLHGIPSDPEGQQKHMDALREKAHGCPACILAAVRQTLERFNRGACAPDEYLWIVFDYKKARDEFFASLPPRGPEY